MSYGEVSNALWLFGLFLSKTTVYYNVQKAGLPLRESSEDWLGRSDGRVRLQRPGLVTAQFAGRSIALAVASNGSSGAEVLVEVTEPATDNMFGERLQTLAEAVGARLITADIDGDNETSRILAL
ncbi:MAG: hypothetical protein HY675_05710 [Chloroflexi bacterium]|nr:hypothetical protein [Chloroflexota bacterium]